MLLQLYRLKAILRTYTVELWSRRWSILGIAWVVGTIGTIAIAAMPDYYKASARIYVDTTTLLKPLLRGLTVEPQTDQQIDLMRKTLLTRPNIEHVIKAAGLDKVPGEQLNLDKLVQAVSRDVGFGFDGGSLFTLSYMNPDPNKAREVVDTLLALFQEQHIGLSRQDIQDSRRFINDQIADYEARLKTIEKKVADFRREHGDDLIAEQTLSNNLQTAESEARQLDTELQSAIWMRDRAKLELARTPATLPGMQAPVVGGVSPQAVRLQEMREKLAVMLLHNTERHPDVVALRQQIELLSDSQGPSKEAPGIPRVPNPTYEQLKTQFNQLDLQVATVQHRLEERRKQVEAIRRRMVALPAVELAAAQLDRDYDVLKKNYEELIARRESARLSEQVEVHNLAGTVRVVEPPVQPTIPAGPPRTRLLLALAVASFAIGIGVALLMIQLRDTFSSIWQLRDSFDLPILGSVSMTDYGEGGLHLIRGTVYASAFLALLSLYGGALYVFRTHDMRAELIGSAKILYEDVSQDFHIDWFWNLAKARPSA